MGLYITMIVIYIGGSSFVIDRIVVIELDLYVLDVMLVILEFCDFE